MAKRRWGAGTSGGRGGQFREGPRADQVAAPTGGMSLASQQEIADIERPQTMSNGNRQQEFIELSKEAVRKPETPLISRSLSPPKLRGSTTGTLQGEPPDRSSARERREAKFMARTDRELAEEPRQVTAQMAALSARSPEVLERLMKNSGIHPKILQHGCKNKAATAETWNLAAQNMLTRMSRVPVTLGEEDANTAMAETAAYILGRDTPRNPLPPETAELAEKVWDQVSQRQDEWRLLKDDSLRQRGWIES